MVAQVVSHPALNYFPSDFHFLNNLSAFVCYSGSAVFAAKDKFIEESSTYVKVVAFNVNKYLVCQTRHAAKDCKIIKTWHCLKTVFCKSLFLV